MKCLISIFFVFILFTSCTSPEEDIRAVYGNREEVYYALKGFFVETRNNGKMVIASGSNNYVYHPDGDKILKVDEAKTHLILVDETDVRDPDQMISRLRRCVEVVKKYNIDSANGEMGAYSDMFLIIKIRKHYEIMYIPKYPAKVDMQNKESYLTYRHIQELGEGWYWQTLLKNKH